MKCLYCGQTLRWVQGRGYVHLQGGPYVMRCPDCGWEGAPYPSLARCPACGSPRLRDDHCAMPNHASGRD